MYILAHRLVIRHPSPLPFCFKQNIIRDRILIPLLSLPALKATGFPGAFR